MSSNQIEVAKVPPHSPPVRGENVSTRGRGGGFLPKKRTTPPANVQQLQQQKQQNSRNPSSEKENNEEGCVVEDDVAEAETKPKDFKFAIPEEAKMTKMPGEEEKQKDEQPETKAIAEKLTEEGQNNENGTSSPHEQPTQHQDKKKQKKDFVCFICHEPGHVKATCPKRTNTCFYCKEEGHVIADCERRLQKTVKKDKNASMMINYTCRKNKSNERPDGGTSSGGNNHFVTRPYECNSDDEDEGKQKGGGGKAEKEKKEGPKVVVPIPMPVAAVKPQVQLRSKLLSTDSEPSQQQLVVNARSESSEEEDADEEDEPAAEEEEKAEDAKKEEGGEEELETVTFNVDGCVEFDYSDDSDSYFDCSEGKFADEKAGSEKEEAEDEEGGGEKQRKKKLKRIVEVDEMYGDHGALLDLEGAEKKLEGTAATAVEERAEAEGSKKKAEGEPEEQPQQQT